MPATLHPDLEAFVREMADGEEFRDEAEVLAEALFLLWQQRFLARPGEADSSPA